MRERTRAEVAQEIDDLAVSFGRDCPRGLIGVAMAVALAVVVVGGVFLSRRDTHTGGAREPLRGR